MPGAAVIDVKMDETGVFIAGSISRSFKKDFEEYAQACHLPVKTLRELLKYNEADPARRIKYGRPLSPGLSRNRNC